MKKILLIVPAYNEEENIEYVINDFNNMSADHPEYDILIVNDCSVDATEKRLQEFGADHISFPINLGIGGLFRPDIFMH